MARTNLTPDDRDKLLDQLAHEILEVGPIIGANLSLDPPEDLCAPLYEVCARKIEGFDLQRSLRAWIWSHGQLVGLAVRREQHRSAGAEMTTDPVDHRLTSTILADDPNVLEDELIEEVESLLERQRQSWRRKREACWVEALRAAQRQDGREAEAEVQRTALYDVFISSNTPRLVIPWRVLVQGADRQELAGEYGLSRDAIDKRISRFQQQVRDRLRFLASELESATGISLN